MTTARATQPAQAVATENWTVQGRAGAIPVREYRPAAERPSALPFVWIHGGGFISGNLDQKESDALARSIAAGGRRVLTVDYRLVPAWPFVGKFKLKPSENRYPAAREDVEDAVLDFTSRAPGGFTVGGASAGACLAATASMRFRDGGLQLPSALVLAYGTLHAELPPSPPALREHLRGTNRLQPFTPRFTRNMHLNYAGSEENLREAFPGGGDLHDLPPTLILDADHDTLRASGEAFATELAAAGVEVTSGYIPGTRHGFLNRPKTDAYAEGVRRITTFLNRLDG